MIDIKQNYVRPANRKRLGNNRFNSGDIPQKENPELIKMCNDYPSGVELFNSKRTLSFNITIKI